MHNFLWEGVTVLHPLTPLIQNSCKRKDEGGGGCIEFKGEIDCFATRVKGKQKRKVHI